MNKETEFLRRNVIDISESLIKEHRRSLRELSDLSKRVSTVLKTQQLPDKNGWEEE
jgi:hypothetical protein